VAPNADGSYPTFVPRNPGITDGAWSRADAAVVTAAEGDARAAVQRKRVDDGGVVLLGKSPEELAALAVRARPPGCGGAGGASGSGGAPSAGAPPCRRASLAGCPPRPRPCRPHHSLSLPLTPAAFSSLHSQPNPQQNPLKTQKTQVECGQPSYRGRQLYDAVLQGARSVEAISTLPLAWREQLKGMGVRRATRPASPSPPRAPPSSPDVFFFLPRAAAAAALSGPAAALTALPLSTPHVASLPGRRRRNAHTSRSLSRAGRGAP